MDRSALTMMESYSRQPFPSPGLGKGSRTTVSSDELCWAGTDARCALLTARYALCPDEIPAQLNHCSNSKPHVLTHPLSVLCTLHTTGTSPSSSRSRRLVSCHTLNRARRHHRLCIFATLALYSLARFYHRESATSSLLSSDACPGIST